MIPNYATTYNVGQYPMGIRERKTVKQELLTLISRRILTSKFPMDLYIEPTNNCNLACTICPQKESVRAKGFMKVSLFRKIIDECVGNDGISQIILHKDGESLLHPHIFEMISYAKEKRAAKVVRLSTNGLLLDKEKIDNLFNSGLDSITFSIDGGRAETYETIRKGADFKRLKDNIGDFISVRKRLKKRRPFITLQMVNLKENRGELEELKKIWGSQVERIVKKDFLSWGGRFNKGVRQGQMSERNPCGNLWLSAAINWDGRVSICCLDYDARAIVGDVNKESLQSIWQGKAIKKFRLAHLQGRYEKLKICKSCLDWEVNKNLWTEDNIAFALANCTPNDPSREAWVRYRVQDTRFK